jgi:hypothetical protein
MNDNLSPHQFMYHATDVDLDKETHVLPPSHTGRQPHWDDMDPSEQHKVFLSSTLDGARGWGSEIAGMEGRPFHVYRVRPEGEITGSATSGVYAASRARIERRVYSYDPAKDD